MASVGAGVGAAAAAGDGKAVETVTLVSAEGERFTVARRVAVQSELCRTLTEDDATDEIPLLDVKSAVLSRVITFMEHHVDNKLPEIEKVGGGAEIGHAHSRHSRRRSPPAPRSR